MKKINNNIYLFLILLSLISCNDKKSVDDSYFTVPFSQNLTPIIAELTNNLSIQGISSSSYWIQQDKMKDTFLFNRSVYIQGTDFKNFTNTSAELIYNYLFLIKTNGRIIPETFEIYIGIDSVFKNSFYLIYQIHKSDYLFNFNDLQQKLLIKNLGIINKKRMNDTIFTNLDKKQILKILPNFTGSVINGKISSIEIDTTSYLVLETVTRI